MATQTLIAWTNVRRVLAEYGEQFVKVYRDKLAKGRINTSKMSLSKSVSYELHGGGTWIAVDISLNDYWRYVEYGRKPGKMPPMSAIEKWIRIKPIAPRAYDGKRVPSVKSLAFLIARKIGLEGIKPKPIFKSTMEGLLSSFDRALAEAVAQDVEKSIDIIIKQY